MELKLKILDKHLGTKAASESGESVVLAHTAPYEDGDIICLEAGGAGCFCILQLDDAMLPALVYLSQNAVYCKVPFGEKRSALSPKAFSGNCHLLSARVADDSEIKTRRNLALNPYSGFVSPGLFPHADANAETRGEAVFAARNAIDGIFANNSHGKFPYGSWGINQRDDAEWKLEFGTPVLLDEIRLTLRADFPHDNYWTKACVEFSNGGAEYISLKKTWQPQRFVFEPARVEWLRLKELTKSEEASPFPALTQFEAWGSYCGD
jgi:hypothetical protein